MQPSSFRTHLIPSNKASSLQRALSEYVEHFHAERNHQGKGNVLLFPRDTDICHEGPVQSGAGPSAGAAAPVVIVAKTIAPVDSRTSIVISPDIADQMTCGKAVINTIRDMIFSEPTLLASVARPPAGGAVTVWPARENLQSFSALWRFEQGQVESGERNPTRLS
jgi:hypothetical protein